MWGRRQTRQWHRVKLLLGWRLTVSRHSELWQKCFMRKAGISNMTQSEESVTLMTFYRLPPHGNRSFTFVQDDDWRFPHYSALPSAVILNRARMPYEKAGKRDSDTEWRIYYSDDVLPASLIAETDPSHSFRMTTDAFLIIAPCRPRSFWMDARMPYEKAGKRNSSTEWRIYYSDDILRLSSPW